MDLLKKKKRMDIFFYQKAYGFGRGGRARLVILNAIHRNFKVLAAEDGVALGGVGWGGGTLHWYLAVSWTSRTGTHIVCELNLSPPFFLPARRDFPSPPPQSLFFSCFSRKLFICFRVAVFVCFVKEKLIKN